MKFLAVSFFAIVLCSSAVAAESRLDTQPADSTFSLLEKQLGQVVELRLKSGEKIAGKVEKVTGMFVQLSSLAGMEFYEAAVSVGDISAIVVRVKSK